MKKLLLNSVYFLFLAWCVWRICVWAGAEPSDTRTNVLWYYGVAGGLVLCKCALVVFDAWMERAEDRG